MRPRDLSPDAANLGAVLEVLGPVDVSDALAEVEIGVLGGLDALNFQEAVMRVSKT